MEEPLSPTSPKVELDDTFTKAHDVVEAVKQLQDRQQEADRKVGKEIRAHAETKHKIKAIESEQVQAREAAEAEAGKHFQTKEKLMREDRAHIKTKDALQAAKDDVASMRLQMDAMKVEMEAQRKAFVINVNWAARCTELKTKFDQSCHEYDQLLEQHVKAKAEMDQALRAQEEFRMKHQAAADACTSTQEELDRQSKEVEAKKQLSGDIATRLEQLDEWKAKEQKEILQKKLGSQQALAVMQRSLAKGDDGIKTSAFQGWMTVATKEKKDRIRKDKVMQRTLKTIATEGMAVVCEVFQDWSKEMYAVKRAALAAAAKRLEEANAGGGASLGRQRAIQQMEKQFKGEDFSLTQTCFQGWASGQVARKKLENNHKKATRMIAGSGLAMLAEVFGLWNDLTEKRRKKAKQQAANMKSAGRIIANSDKALTSHVFGSWLGWVDDNKRKRKTDEAGTAKAVRMMANSANTLANLCFDSWAKDYKVQKKKKGGNSKALRMIADSAKAMLIAVWKCWADARENKKAKQSSTAKAVRMINNSTEALRASCYQSWATYVMKNKDKNKKIRALEKSFGAEDSGRKMIVFTAWLGFAKVESRKKNVKGQTMKTAIKSITGNQELLKCHIFLAWGRFANMEKAEKNGSSIKNLEEQLIVAVEAARIAVEQDLVAAQAKVLEVKEDLARKTVEKEEYVGKMDGLNGELDKAEQALAEHEKQVKSLAGELEQSRKRAVDIGQELSKVGIYMEKATPRKAQRSGSGGGRPRSGNSQKVEPLPAIGGSNSRPDSGMSGKGSMTARGVAGERGAPKSRDGRPPRNPEDGGERRYLMDGSGPFTFGEFQEIYGEKGTVDMWSTGKAEYDLGDY